MSKPKSSIKSGVDFKQFASLNGGVPAKKSVEAIEKESRPKSAPKSTGR